MKLAQSKYVPLLCVTLLLFGAPTILHAQKKLKHILVFSKTDTGYRHASIEAGKQMFVKMAKEKSFVADTTEDASLFNDAALKQYDVVVFLSTRGNILDTFQQEAFQHFIHRGGGFVGIHAATTTEYTWPWYNKLIGAYFDGHPAPQKATYTKVDKNFFPTKSFPATLQWMDEIYNFRSVQDSLHYVITVDEQSYTGGKMGSFHPACWYHTFEGGRAFYIALGHFDDAYNDPLFTTIIYNSLRWAAGENR
jgi:type 1 glutamine amidotransferase